MKTVIERKMDDLGRIVLPVEARSAIGAKEKDRFMIEVTGHNRITLTLQKDDTCVQCNRTQDVVTTPFGYICKKCLFNLMVTYFHNELDDKMDEAYSMFFPKQVRERENEPELVCGSME